MIERPALSIPEKRRKFCEVIRKTGNVARACAAIGVERSLPYKHRMSDKEFADMWKNAEEARVDDLVEESERRAAKGVLEPVFYQGSRCGHVRRYSDSLLMFNIKAKRVEYRDKVEHSGMIEQRVKFTFGKKK